MSRPKATVCIPWRPSPSRMAPFERVMAFWAKTGWPIITADSDTEIFSLSQARNNAVRQANTRVVIVADADTIPPMNSVRAAVADPIGITWPFKSWKLIPADWVNRPVTEFCDAPVVLEYPGGLGGVMVCERGEYWRLGGQPEEFIGWGYEDCAFHFVARTLSTFRRMPGVAYSIDHNDDAGGADTPGWSRTNDANRALMEPYRAASGRPWLMREILRRRDETLIGG